MVIHDMPSEHYRSREGRPAKYIIVHSLAAWPGATPTTVAGYLQRNGRGVSVHEYAAPDWHVYEMVPDRLGSNNCWSRSVRFPDGEHYDLANLITWGIEIHQIADEDCPRDATLLAALRVVLACERLGIPPKRVLGHGEIDPSRKSDPVGVNMDWFRATVKGLL